MMYLTGDATYPEKSDGILIPHIVNDCGAWGAGFVLALSKRWTTPEAQFRKFSPLPLGTTQFIFVQDVRKDFRQELIIANMCAQHGVRNSRIPPINYDSLISCMNTIIANKNCLNFKQIVAPRFGSGLAGGDWGVIEKLIQTVWEPHVFVHIYDLP